MAGGGDQKSWMVALLLSIFLGQLGVDRFYLGYMGLGVAKLLTCGGCGVWQIIDVIMIAMDKIPDANGQPLAKG
jgi:TM2 domain-containing membrane protein YozV